MSQEFWASMNRSKFFLVHTTLKIFSSDRSIERKVGKIARSTCSNRSSASYERKRTNRSFASSLTSTFMCASLYSYSVSRSFFRTPPVDNGKQILTVMDSNDSGIAYDLHEDSYCSIESEYTITDDGRVNQTVDICWILFLLSLKFVVHQWFLTTTRNSSVQILFGHGMVNSLD